MYINLWDETIKALTLAGKTWEDIKYIIGQHYQISKEDFETVAKKTNYDNGYGGNEIPSDLELWSEDFHLIRGEYDGAEWWEVHNHTITPPPYLVPCVSLFGYDMEEANGKLSYWKKMGKVQNLTTKGEE